MSPLHWHAVMGVVYVIILAYNVGSKFGATFICACMLY